MAVLRKLSRFSDIARVYREHMTRDFAPDERRPLSWLWRSWIRGEYEGWGLYEGEAFLGYALFVRLGDWRLFDYFAIVPEHRCEGRGTQFLRLLAEKMKDARAVIGEVEDPDRAETREDRLLRQRRLRFYTDEGYVDTGITSQVFGVDYRILRVPGGGPVTDAEIRDAYRRIYRTLFSERVFKTRFFLPDNEF